MITMEELREQLKENPTPLNKLLVNLVQQNESVGLILKAYQNRIQELERMVEIHERRWMS